jgi:prepilin-type N-terminal cleavage/methylation domain-containing protein
MASRKTSTARGFTLIEMLVVIGLVTAFASLSLFIDLNSYRGDAFRAERNTVVTLLQRARADALNNIGQDPHGVAIFPADHPHSYVLFAGADYAASPGSTREVFDMSYAIELTAGPNEIVFQQLSGATAYDGSLTLRDTERGMDTVITINKEGLID